MRKIKNILSIPFGSKFIFNSFERILRKNSGGYILSFHDLSPNTFESQVEFLKPCKPIPLDELISRYKSGKNIENCFAITFDDGVETTIKENWSVCEKNNWPVTFYLPTDYLNGNNLPFQKIQLLENSLENKSYKLPSIIDEKQKIVTKNELIFYLKSIIYFKDYQYVKNYLDYFLDLIPEKKKIKNYGDFMPKAIDWSEVKKISKNELSSFQSHGVTHTSSSALSNKDLESEMIKSKELIEDCTGQKVNSFCYPYGSKRSINNLSINLASRHFDYSTTLLKGRLRPNLNLHFLPRIDLYEENSNSFVKMKILLS